MTRRTGLCLCVIVGLLLAAGFARLRIDAEILNLLPGDLPVVAGLKLYQHNFTDSRELILTLRGPDAAQAEASARSLAQALRVETNLVAGVVWEPAWMERPAEAAELIGYLWFNQPPTVFGELTNRLLGAHIDATLADAREQLATSFSPLDLARRGYDPYDLLHLPESVAGGGSSFGEGQNLFASGDGTFRVMFVKAQPDIANYRACIEWIKRVKAVVESARARGEVPAEVAIGYTGGPAFVAEISSGMEHDMSSSIGITSAIIALLFWFFHRRWIPMLWLLFLLAVILACTLAVGGLIFGAINVVSLGFAGILLGLAVDYGVVHYQEALASPQAIIPEIRRAIGPSIFWAAVTTISAFLVLNFGGLPGLAQLGSLVAIGVTLSALVMLFAFLPPLFRDRMRALLEAAQPLDFSKSANEKTRLVGARETSSPPAAPAFLRQRGLVLGLTAALILVGCAVLLTGAPGLDHTADALRPKHSPAYAALDEIKAHLAQNREPLWVIFRGRDETEVGRQLQAAQSVLEVAVTNHEIGNFTLPTPLWPRPDYQAANRATAALLLTAREPLGQRALAQGFSTNALVMTDAILDTWQAAQAHPGVFWPANEMSRWIMEKVASRKPGEFLAVGFITPAANAPYALAAALAQQGVILSGWDLLGPAILQRVQANLWKVVLPMVFLVLLSLTLAFRRWTEILLSLAVLALSGLCLLSVMRFAGWSWNLLNLMALPLMLGSGVDYSIFMQLALRRHSGDLAAAHRSVGRALLLCGGTAVAGFSSLAWSTNAGMASLGQVCAIGIGSNMLISVYLLPIWWRELAPTLRAGQKSPQRRPSALYRAELWSLGQAVTRRMSPKTCARVSRSLAGIYWNLAANRREIVTQNLMPPLGGDRGAAQRKGRELLDNFAVKVADLWRYESGLSIQHLFAGWTGWEHFEAAQAEKRGILLITPHLGNWEFGGPLLTQRGINLQVITLAEPGNGFTEMRQKSRAHWDIETLVIGEDPFAFVEVIRRLDAGATVALLVDRPPAASSVTVELFGRPFAASVAAAELARASGCVLLPVYLPLTSQGYSAHILPPVPYDRAALRIRENRRLLTQDILKVFEPIIRRHLDQWYHFVPIWPRPTNEK